MTCRKPVSALYFVSCFAFAFTAAKLTTSAAAQAPQGEFHDAVARAEQFSTLAEPKATPFHLKMTGQDTTLRDADYNVEIEVWWAAPDKWRRVVKSAAFTQTAVQNGARYYESNSADYLPYWIDQLVRGAISPIPVAEFATVSASSDRPGCQNWESEHGSGDEKFSTYDSICFNADGTASQIFAEPIGLELAYYKDFNGKKIARQLHVWPGDRSEVVATVTVLEPLEKWRDSGSGITVASLFNPPGETNYASRLRFVLVPDSALTAADLPARPPLTWPSTYTFPVDGAIAIDVKIDRAGNIREFPSAISKNQRINGGAVEQIKNWKFKPYVVGGAPVEVLTTLLVPFHLKYEPLGANGKEFPPISFGEHIKTYRALSDLRAEGSAAFHLRASFVLANGSAGTYQETWKSPDEWARQVELGGSVLQLVRTGGHTTTTGGGDPVSRATMVVIGAAMQDHLPDPRTFQEADWGNSVVPESNVDPSTGADTGEPVLIRPARGAVDTNNHPTSGRAYWFDSDGLLRASFEEPLRIVYSDFVPWDAKRVARHFELFMGSARAAEISVNSIEAR